MSKPTEIRFQNPESINLGPHIADCAARNLPLVDKDRHSGDRGAVICGLGNSLQKPSILRQVRAKAKQGWTIFGLKEAITFLKDRNIPVHYSCNMDPQAKEVARTPIYPEVIYCVASSCHPELFDHAINGGARVEVFHSACGYMDRKMVPGFVLDLPPDQKAIVAQQVELATDDGYRFTPVCVAAVEEVEVYRRLFGVGDTCCGGFTVANRALALAKYMGFEKVILAGVDFGWRDGSEYYAPFCEAQPMKDVFLHDSGRVDGKNWHTRPDLMASAVDVARRIKRGEVKVLGDSLAAALAKRDDEYLDKVCTVQ